MLCLSVQLSRQHPADRHAVRHQGDHAKGLRSVGAGARLFRQFRSVRRFRSDLRRGETESQDHRDPDPLQGADLRRDPDLAFSRRLAAPEDGVVRLSQIEGDLEISRRHSGTRVFAWPESRYILIEALFASSALFALSIAACAAFLSWMRRAAPEVN